MGSRFPSHQLSNGLYVSGRPEQPKPRLPTMGSAPLPYTGGDIKRSGGFGKMFGLSVHESKSRKSGAIDALSGTSSFGVEASNSGPIYPNAVARSSYCSSGPAPPSMISGPASMKKTTSVPLSKHGEPIKKSSGTQPGGVTHQNSCPVPPVLPATGLITSGPLNSSGAPRNISGPLDSSGALKLHGSLLRNNQGVTTLAQHDKYSVIKNIPKPIMYALILLLVMGFITGVFIFEALHSYVLVVLVIVSFCIIGVLLLWNSCWGRKAAIGYLAGYPDSELRTAKNGQYVKVSGVVACGNVPLESSFKKVPGCVYTSTSLHEYRCFTWFLRATEKHVVDFYISDFQSGLIALVKTGYGVRVTPYVDESVVIDVHPPKKDSNPDFFRWMGERNLSFDGRALRLKEGYIKEGSTVSVMGVVQRNENELMIVPPPEPVTIGCQWTKCIFPASFEGVVLRSEKSSNEDVIHV